MNKMILAALGAATMGTASAAQAAVQIVFNSPAGDILSNSQVYSNGTYSVTALGYSNFNFSTNTGTANNLWGKVDNVNADENGVGLKGDPSGQHEIWYGGGETTPAIILDVSSLLSSTTLGQFMMGSTTGGESWIINGFNSNTGKWTISLQTGSTEGTLINLLGWGTYSKYAFVAGGPSISSDLNIQNINNDDEKNTGNVLLSALSFTPSAVPEPASWAMMLLGFGGIGFVMRRGRKNDKPVLAQIA